MSKVLITESNLTAIANAIRGRNGSSNTYKPGQMAAAVTAIPNSYAAGDEGKVVDNGALVAQGSLEVTENDTYDPTKINSVTVNVSGSGEMVPGAVRLTPYKEDDNTGYVSVSMDAWYAYTLNYLDCRSDFYELDPADGATRYLLIFFGSAGGNRCRAVVISTDPTTIAEGVATTVAGEYLNVRDSTVQGPWRTFTGDTVAGAYSGGLFKITGITTKKYLVIGKTNESVDNITSYVVDIGGVQ